MTEFTLTIHLGNDAMRTPEDVADALTRIAREIRSNPGAIYKSINDLNGNQVGIYEFRQ